MHIYPCCTAVWSALWWTTCHAIALQQQREVEDGSELCTDAGDPASLPSHAETAPHHATPCILSCLKLLCLYALCLCWHQALVLEVARILQHEVVKGST